MSSCVKFTRERRGYRDSEVREGLEGVEICNGGECCYASWDQGTRRNV